VSKLNYLGTYKFLQIKLVEKHHNFYFILKDFMINSFLSGEELPKKKKDKIFFLKVGNFFSMKKSFVLKLISQAC